MQNLKNKVQEVQEATGKSLGALSLALGRSRNSLAQTLRNGASTAMQEQLIAELNYYKRTGNRPDVVGLIAMDAASRAEIERLSNFIYERNILISKLQTDISNKSRVTDYYVNAQKYYKYKFKTVPKFFIFVLFFVVIVHHVGYIFDSICSILSGDLSFSVALNGSLGVLMLFWMVTQWSQYQEWRKG